jgi:capsular polysaccharide biosynthesis protein
MDNHLLLVLRVIKNRIWLILLVILVVCGSTAVYTLYLVKPVYEASTRIIVNNKNVPDMKALDTSQLNASIQMIETYKLIIKSPKIMNAVVKDHPDLHMSVQQLFDSIAVSSVSNTQVMIIAAKDGSYEKAVKISNAVSQQFVSEIPSVMKLDNVLILDDASSSLDRKQVSPDPVLSILLGFVLSLLLSSGLVFILEYFDDTFKSEENLQDLLGIPLLGTIHKMTQRKIKSKLRIVKGRVADSKYAG